MEQPNFDFNLVCRTCKSASSDMRNVFEQYENATVVSRIDEMLMACTSIQATVDDGLPHLMCQICLEQLKNAFVFKEKALKTEALLKESVKNLKNVVKQEDSGNADFMETLNDLFQETTQIPNAQQTQDNPQGLTSDFIQILENNQILLTCRECMKMFTTLEGLRCHKRIHLGGMFKCKTCDKEYTRLNHLQRHELSHGRRKVHVCRICNKTLTRMEHLKRHLTTHLKEKPFGCKTCNRGFNRIENLHHHTPRCKGEIVHICDICNKVFNREDSLDVHKRMHDIQAPALPTIDNLDNIEEHYYEIDFDGDPMQIADETSDMEDCFEPQVEVTENLDVDKIKEVEDIGRVEDSLDTTEGNNEEHESHNDEDTTLEDTCNDDTSSIEGDTGADLNTTVEKEDDEFGVKDNIDNITTKIEVEESELTDTQDLLNIVKEMDAEAYEDASVDDSDEEYQPRKKLSKRRGRPPKDPNSPPKVKTPKVAGRGRGRPPGSTNVNRFKKENSDEVITEFPCPICQEVFRTPLKLDRHARKQHAGMKIHKCDVCNKEFDRANHLRRHRMSHSSEKPYQCQVVAEKKYGCPLCNKFFTTEKYRDVHAKGHNGEKEYRCKTCLKSFISKSHLTEHMKFHNDHSKKFLCSECGQRFIRNDYLVIHMRRHRGEKPFKCKYCGKGFPRTTDLTVHERYHTGEKTHLCTICGRGFGRAYNLTVHMRTHTGEKPYQCTYCDAAFAQGNDLKAHIRRHTGERFQCELCTESFLMGYLLTQHKRTVHGLNVVSNIRRLQPIHKIEENPDEPPPITIPLPKPVVPDSILNSLHHQLAVAQFHHLARPEQQQQVGNTGVGLTSQLNRTATEQLPTHVTMSTQRQDQQLIHITRPDQQLAMPLHHM
ncbi:zinc finger protein 652-like isoform X2 [Aethina tumida]|uniref:zinc finger protein 652-like isoform X2 n=1 Tax=Aethina tumida TaxID=116153 RepID=UPI0021482F7D|nr:zinc finger protein 652-like isoform X2 [Aethina tumida]